MTTNAHTCAGCPMCIPELSPDYWRRRAHAAEKRSQELEQENEKLKRLVADKELDLMMLKDVLSKKF